MCKCNLCGKRSDTFLRGPVTFHTAMPYKAELVICSCCLDELAKKRAEKYGPKKVETTTDPWEAWSTPTDES
jgi:hypothetical protein